MILAALLLFTASSSTLPETPVVKAEHPIFNRYDYALYGGILAYRIGDYFTTERVLGHGGHEAELPEVFVASKAGFAAYSLGMAGLEVAGSIYLHRHGHVKLARFADMFSISTGVATDIHNIGAVRW